MKCPICQSKSTKVIQSKHGKSDQINRKRTCLDCGHKFATTEIIQDTVEPSMESPDKSLATINRKLNILAQVLLKMQQTPAKGVQSKKKKSSLNTSATLNQYESELLIDFDEDDTPDPNDIRAWAELIASLD